MSDKKKTKEEKRPKVYTVAKSGDIITARPDGMPFEEYRKILKDQNRKLKFRLMGCMVWKSSYSVSEGESPWGKLEAFGTLRGAAPTIRFR